MTFHVDDFTVRGQGEMRFLYAAMWLAIFSGIGWYIYTGGVDTYHGRKGRLAAELLSSVANSIGHLPAALICVAIGIALAAWAMFGKDEDEAAE
jgi:hypothetical protein